MTQSFANKVVLVTGSSSGIGAGIALEFVKQGAKVVITGRSTSSLQSVAEACQKASTSGAEIHQVIGDFASESGLPERLIKETIDKFGKLDILVNNAGAGAGKDYITEPTILEQFDAVYHLNVRSLLAMTHFAVPHLEKTKGNIVNISSIASTGGSFPVYGSSKAAVDMLTKTTALQLAPKGIRVNSVNPGPCKTNFIRIRGLQGEQADQLWDTIGTKMPLGFCPEPKDIANLVLFVANQELARNMTGSILVSDTGRLVDPGCLRDILHGGTTPKN